MGDGQPSDREVIQRCQRGCLAANISFFFCLACADNIRHKANFLSGQAAR